MTFTRKELLTLDWILNDKLKDLRYFQKYPLTEFNQDELIEIDSDIEQVLNLIKKVEEEL